MLIKEKKNQHTKFILFPPHTARQKKKKKARNFLIAEGIYDIVCVSSG